MSTPRAATRARHENDQPSNAGAVGERALDFRGLVGDLQSEDVATRRDAAVLLSNLGLESAARPLLRSYMAYGDEWMREALRHYGAAITPHARREAEEPGVGAEAMGRLMTALGDSGDPAAVGVVRAYADNPSLTLHAASCAALARLGDRSGIGRLRADLVAVDPERRLVALEVLHALDTDDARAARRDHVRRYLGGAGAVPEEIGVHAPLLIDPGRDLADMVAGLLPELEEDLVLAVGPASGVLSEKFRKVVAAAVPEWRLLFTTPRHSLDEHLAILRRARDYARRRPRSAGGVPVLCMGPIPAPAGEPPLWHLLTWLPTDAYTVRVLFLGPTDYGVLIDWWRYAAEVAEVPVRMDAIVDLITLDAQRMTPEERLLHLELDGDEREPFARAMLSRL